MKVLFLVGLTGVGKSTVLPVVLARQTGAPLPDRRELTDRVIIPAAQRLAGQEPSPVSDRLERFRLTARYREAHPEGIVHALVRHLDSLAPVDREALEPATGTAGLYMRRVPRAGQSNDAGCQEPVFDGLRGVDEVTAAAKRFPSARFLMLEARPETRVARLAGRSDSFDRVAPRADANAAIPAPAELAAIPGVADVLDPDGLASHWEAAPERWSDLLRAVEIVVEEQRHYDQAGARRYLESLPPARRLLLDTDELSSPDVARQVAQWL